MQNSIQIENIEERRRVVGIEDDVLREGIRQLETGNLVRLTLLTDTVSPGGETVLVRITSINGATFRGKLVSRPISTGLRWLEAGARINFARSHIHSLPAGQDTDDQ